MIKETKSGLEHFHTVTCQNLEPLYQKLAHEQHPHTLFITCSDSRIDPQLLTGAKPGDMFTIRNIANIIPTPDDPFQDFTTLSAIEFAVEVLNVKQIIVCGHSNCGGCKAALDGAQATAHLPFTKAYLKALDPVRESVEKDAADMLYENKYRLMEQRNLIEQVNHLKKYEFIQKRVEEGRLEIEGWHYTIETGEIAVLDEEKSRFVHLFK